ncbi:hypothetical protein ACFSTD_05570 [Novosphingobium colocasiae]
MTTIDSELSSASGATLTDAEDAAMSCAKAGAPASSAIALAEA